jgi:hypothetical protein
MSKAGVLNVFRRGETFPLSYWLAGERFIKKDNLLKFLAIYEINTDYYYKLVHILITTVIAFIKLVISEIDIDTVFVGLIFQHKVAIRICSSSAHQKNAS